MAFFTGMLQRGSRNLSGPHPKMGFLNKTSTQGITHHKRVSYAFVMIQIIGKMFNFFFRLGTPIYSFRALTKIMACAIRNNDSFDLTI